jgi:hypothetical protein
MVILKTFGLLVKPYFDWLTLMGENFQKDNLIFTVGAKLSGTTKYQNPLTCVIFTCVHLSVFSSGSSTSGQRVCKEKEQT